MIKKFFTGIIYLTVALACINGISGYFYIEDEPNEYEKTINMFEYQLGYQSVYITHPQNEPAVEISADTIEKGKIVYLTFDDGPSQRTTEILDILKKYDIKATFFVLYNDSSQAREIIKRAYDEGHTIGVHSTSHSYKEIYKSVDSFLSDFEICFNYINEITGDLPSIFRFPGGSVNNYNKNVRKDIVKELSRRGFTYFDWNVSGEDATNSYTEESIYNDVVMGCKGRTSSVVLLHDSSTKKETVAALERIIPDLLEQGYIFRPLDENVKPTVFKIE